MIIGSDWATRIGPGPAMQQSRSTIMFFNGSCFYPQDSGTPRMKPTWVWSLKETLLYSSGNHTGPAQFSPLLSPVMRSEVRREEELLARFGTNLFFMFAPLKGRGLEDVLTHGTWSWQCFRSHTEFSIGKMLFPLWAWQMPQKSLLLGPGIPVKAMVSLKSDATYREGFHPKHHHHHTFDRCALQNCLPYCTHDCFQKKPVHVGK